MDKNFINRLFNRKPKAEWTSDNIPVGSLADVPFWDLRTLTHFNNDQYENGYADIRAIANRFLMIKPTAIDSNGKALSNNNVINCLARPNQQTSGVDFRDQLAVMSLVHDKVYILVWERLSKSEVIPARPGVKENKVAGFTFLEGVSEQFIDGVLSYRVAVNGVQRAFYPHQVMTFFDVNPGNLSSGYSPSRSARRWTRIDDYIADYQTGFFKNGAIPSGQFIITAPTKQDYEDIVKNMKDKHRGAGKNNNVMYSYAPLDPVTNKPAQSSVTWVPFNVTNKDMNLKDLFEQANKKVSASFGVPDFIKGDSEAPNFATAQVIERNFVENKIRPFAIKKWARFQHELNRITGGLGYGITFKLETPNIADEDESMARTNTLNVTALTTLTSFGYSLDTSITALNLPNNWRMLKKGSADSAGAIENDKPDVDEGDEVEGAPDTLEAANRTNPKAHNHKEVSNLTSSDESYYEAQINQVAEKVMSKQIEDAISALDGEQNVTDTDEEDFLTDMMPIITTILLMEGITQWEQGKLLLMSQGIIAPNGSYALTTDALTRYRKYLKGLFKSYTDDTAAVIRTVLERSTAENFTRLETESALRSILTTDRWRVTRIGVSETNRSSALGSVEAMIKIQDESEATLEKTMASKTGSPCEFCATRIGVWFPVKKTMIKKGDVVKGVDGGIFVNNWDNNGGHDLHANGACYPEYRVVTN